MLSSTTKRRRLSQAGGWSGPGKRNSGTEGRRRSGNPVQVPGDGQKSWHEHAGVPDWGRSGGGWGRSVSTASEVSGGLTGSIAPFYRKNLFCRRPAAAGQSRLL